MVKNILSLGDRIELKKPLKLTNNAEEENEENAKKVKPFISQIYDILNGDQLKIAMPIVSGRVIPLPLHARYDACFFTSGGLYQAKVVITNRYKEDGLYILVIDLTSELKKFQRRQYFRLEYTMDVKYKVITEEEVMIAVSDPEGLEEILSEEVVDGIALDISGGGMRFTSSKPIEKDSNILVLVDIGIGEEKETCFVANVVFSGKIQNRDNIYEHRIEFKNMKNTVREILIKFIFETERRMRKRD